MLRLEPQNDGIVRDLGLTNLHPPRARISLVLIGLLVLVAVAKVGVDQLTRPPLTLELVVDGLDRPTAMVATSEGLLVGEQDGAVHLIEDGALRPWLDLTSLIRAGGEEGLLGIAVHPGFPEVERAFVTYTALNGDTVLAEFAATALGADLGSESQLLRIPQETQFHKGGGMAFDPDGLLYVGIGDDAWDHRQFRTPPLTELRGVILRVDVDASAPYGIPPDNPFATGGGRPEIWDHGFRNPWRLSFDGDDLYIADVGSDDWEEVDRHPSGAPGGLNFGWSVMEGPNCRSPDGCDSAPFTAPFVAYPHGEGDCAVIGGFVMPPRDGSPLGGRYAFADHCTGVVSTADPAADNPSPTPVFDTDFLVSTLALYDGELYVADYAGGGIHRLICTGC